MSYTLLQASKVTGKSKMTLQRAIKKGLISANKDDKGHYKIDPSELHRVYKDTSHDTHQNISKLRDDTANNNEMLHLRQAEYETKINNLEQERERERTILQDQIEDLRKRLDQESEERRKLTALITHQHEEKKKKRWFW